MSLHKQCGMCPQICRMSSKNVPTGIHIFGVASSFWGVRTWTETELTAKLFTRHSWSVFLSLFSASRLYMGFTRRVTRWRPGAWRPPRIPATLPSCPLTPWQHCRPRHYPLPQPTLSLPHPRSNFRPSWRHHRLEVTWPAWTQNRLQIRWVILGCLWRPNRNI